MPGTTTTSKGEVRGTANTSKPRFDERRQPANTTTSKGEIRGTANAGKTVVVVVAASAAAAVVAVVVVPLVAVTVAALLESVVVAQHARPPTMRMRLRGLSGSPMFAGAPSWIPWCSLLESAFVDSLMSDYRMHAVYLIGPPVREAYGIHRLLAMSLKLTTPICREWKKASWRLLG